MPMKKVRRRVSFSLPEQNENNEELETVNSANVKVSVHEDSSSSDDDDDKSTEATTIAENVSKDESEDSESSTESAETGKEGEGPSLEKQNTTPKKRKRRKQTEDIQDDECSGDSENEDGDTETKGNTSDSEQVSDSEISGEDSSEDEEDASADEAENDTPALSTFGEMTLDPRVERAVERIGWRRPTPVQSAVIPVALSGRDLLVSAPTGSGKTAAYGVPIAQHLCKSDSARTGVKVVVLVPTRELIQQVTAVLKSLCRYIDGIRVAAVVGKKRLGKAPKAKRTKKSGDKLKGDGPLAFDSTADILVGTPVSIVELSEKSNGEALKKVEVVVVDEADLVLNYGYEKDARKALAQIPSTVQAMLLSATLEADGMDGFRKVVLRRPLTVKVTTDADIADGDATGVAHYFAKLSSPKDRFLVAYAMLRLNVLCGKVLIFVNNINAGFRLKLFLDQFKVKTAVLNSELPANSRMHCVEQFNAGIFDVLIATDEFKRDESLVVNHADMQMNSKLLQRKKRIKSRKRKRDGEFGVSRGVDFRNVAAVLNFDVPDNLTTYTHRAGRTARAGASGTVLTLVVSDEEQTNIVNMGNELGVPVGPLAFRMDQIESFRYRVEDCLRMVTDAAVNAARLADVRREIVNSEKLKEYFEENPQDLEALKHDLALAKNVPEHLAHIPSYLLPPALRASVSQEPDGSRFKIQKRTVNSKSGGKKRYSKNDDPLKSFSVNGSRTSRQRFESKYKLKKGIKKGNRRRHSKA